MPSYVVFIRENTHDQAELDIYSSNVKSAMSGHPIRVLAAYGKQEVLEGPAIEGVVILEFPTPETAKAWYSSPAYQEAVQHRFRGATYRGIIVEGV
jgi:uncharacterized protein (DUF1330 family)